MADAKAVFDQAKGQGAKGDGFDKLEELLEIYSKNGTKKRWIVHHTLLMFYIL